MPLTIANTKTSATAKSEEAHRLRRGPGGRTTTVPTPQKTTQRHEARGVHALPAPPAEPSARLCPQGAASASRRDQRDVDDGRAHDHAERDEEGDLAERARPRCSQPMETKYGISAQQSDAATMMAGMPMRAPTIMPAPSVEVESSIAPRSATLPAAMPPAMPARMPPPSLPTEFAQELRVGERAQDVGHREAGRDRSAAAGPRASACRACRRRRRTCRCTGSRGSAATPAAAAGPSTPSPG